jgi:hypothetical protein
MEVATTVNPDPIRISSITSLGCDKYWLIGAWSKFESPYANFSSLAALGLKGFGSTTWHALVLMIVWGPHLAPM